MTSEHHFIECDSMMGKNVMADNFLSRCHCTV